MIKRRQGGLFASDSEEEEGTTNTRIGLFEHDDEYDTIDSIKERKQCKMKQLRDRLEQLEEENHLLHVKLQEKDDEKLKLLSEIRSLDDKVVKRDRKLEKQEQKFREAFVNEQEKVIALEKQLKELEIQSKKGFFDRVKDKLSPRASIPTSSFESSSESDDQDSFSSEQDNKPKQHEPFTRMNDYLEARSLKRREKEEKKEKRVHQEEKWKEAYQREWEDLAKAEKERKANLQRRRRKQRAHSSKNVRRLRRTSLVKPTAPAPVPPRKEPTTEEEEEEEESEVENLPPEPSEAELELYRRQQARLKELYESEQQRREEAEEAELIAGEIHVRIMNWSKGKAMLELLLTLDQASTLAGLLDCKKDLNPMSTAEEIRKAYRSAIRTLHPDKLRNRNISLQEKLEAQEMFHVITKEYEEFKKAVAM